MAHLTCDPYPTTVVQPTVFNIYMDNATTPVASTPTTNPDGSKQLMYDLTSLGVGTHTVQATAAVVDVWGTSESAKSSPLAFTKRDATVKPGSPSNIGLAA